MSETKFSVMESLFNWMQRSKSSSVKRSKFRKFLSTFCRPNNGEDYFATIRLILPGLDRERGSYGLREHVLATCLIEALGMSRDSPDSQKLLNWRKGGPKSGAFAGNFSGVAAEVLQRRQGMTSGGLTIKELNELLDRLASTENRAEKISILRDLIMKTNAKEMKWIIMIILKDLKLGISEKSIFQEFHPDAEDLFNVTCDLKLVCEKLRDRSQRHKRQDIEVGKPVRPQLALRISNSTAAWKKLHGKEVVIECKFDGDRIQIHKNGAEIHFFSRNFLDHSEYGHGMSDVIIQNILVDRCILDGEMLVWDTSSNRFAEFGSNQEIGSVITSYFSRHFTPRQAKEGLDGDRQLCYVAFDILYVGDTSVIHQSLKERHKLLQKVLKPIPGRLEILVPNGGLNSHRPAGEPCWSLIAHNVDDIEKFFKETIENRDEGIVLKDLGSKWEPSDRSGKWLKLKPEYIRAGSDLDVLIIGGYYGSGRRGGENVLAPDTYPRRFVSFCRVGTGLTDEELNTVVTKLKPYFRKYEYPKKAPPSYYEVTNNSKERPDVWVESPEKSIIVSITSDIRTIRSEVFSAPYSLRFPRIDRVRYEKPWHECLDVHSFVELVHSSNGTTQRGSDNAIVQDNKPTRTKLKREKKNVSIVPSHFVQTDVSHVKGETSILSNLMFYFVNVPSSISLDSLHKMVVENGGAFSMNLNNSVTHCIAAESKGLKFQAAKRHGDVIHYSWLFDCCSQKKLLPLQPKYFLFLSNSSKKKLEEDIDAFSDSYYWDLNMADFKQLLSNIHQNEDTKVIGYYKKKYCPKEKWARFHGYCIYFHLPRQFLKNMDWKVLLELAMRRMKSEVSIGGGSVSDNLSHASHVVIMSIAELNVDFDTLLSSFSMADRRLLRSRRLHVVCSQWLEDCFEKDQKLPEDHYSLKPPGFAETIVGEGNKHDLEQEDYRSLDNLEKQDMSPSSNKVGEQRKSNALKKPRIIDLPNRDGKRKRGRSSRTSTNSGRRGAIQPRRTRARYGNKPAKIFEIESDKGASSDEQTIEEVYELSGENRGNSEKVTDEGRSVFNQPRRTSARLINKPAKILENESEGASSDEQSIKGKLEVGCTNNCGTPEIVNTHTSEAQMKDIVKDSESSDRGKAVEREVAEHGKLETSVDPVQAMLLNMIPSLATKKTDSADTILEEKKSEGTHPVKEEDNAKGALRILEEEKAKGVMPECEEGRLPFDANEMPAKKKKVSYKDAANQLLKNW
ncbi:DNA ligase 4 [Abeliophyllum distichum]|uniref:DNA ligase n=1 Tax=Abeliophyllum distichum TaxID=126358 RepID=A0ABD1R2B7_9LAMI